MFLAASLFLIVTALLYGRYVRPVLHDEFSYAIQIQMVAAGRLWMPAHPVGEFFETFYVLHEPKYASLYFPGLAVLFAPTVWLRMPLWIAHALIAGAAVALFYRIMRELFDPAFGLLAAWILLALPHFQLLALMTMAQVPVIFLGLVMIWSFLRWREKSDWRWAALVGAAAGWATITRPLDAVCYALPIGIAMMWRLRKAAWHDRLLSLGILALSAAPFLALQVVFNIGVTGSAFTTPWQYYVQRDAPGAGLGFHTFDGTLRVASELPQKQLFYDRFIVPYLANHDLSSLSTFLLERLMTVLHVGLPHWLLLILVMLGFLKTNVRRILLVAPAALFLVLYAAYPFTMPHYALVAAPAMISLLLSGILAIGRLSPQNASRIRTGLASTLALVCVLIQPQAAELIQAHRSQLLISADNAVQSIRAPAVLLFTYWPGRNIHVEPVYNHAVAWPDDAGVIRAHDLGDRSGRIFRYYAEHQPSRNFYIFDERTHGIRYLGTAESLARTAGASF